MNVNFFQDSPPHLMQDNSQTAQEEYGRYGYSLSQRKVQRPDDADWKCYHYKIQSTVEWLSGYHDEVEALAIRRGSHVP